MVIWWFFTNYGTQLIYLGVGLWFANGLRKAIFKSRVRVISFSKTKAGLFVETERQQLLPPWLTFKETWMAHPNQAYTRGYDRYQFTDYIREPDGVAMSDWRFKPFGHPLSNQLTSALNVKKARDDETEELLKEESRRAQA